MEDIIWTVTEPDGKVTRQGTKLPYWEPFVINDKTPKGQLIVIERWNLMQKCLIENGLMEPK